MLRPTGNRVLVRPDQAPDETDSGLVIPESARRDPEMSGVVVAVGRGPDAAHKVRQATINRCIAILNETAEQVSSSCLHVEVARRLAQYAVDVVDLSGVQEGDTVCFPYTAGQKLSVEGDTLIVLKEDDIVATWTPDVKDNAA